jgi:hypothetical protein
MSEIFFSLILHLTDKGQEISEENCGVTNLPKNTIFVLISAQASKKWSYLNNKGTLLH